MISGHFHVIKCDTLRSLAKPLEYGERVGGDAVTLSPQEGHIAVLD